MPASSKGGEQGNNEMRVAIEEIRGSINVILNRIETLVKAVDNLSSTAVTREELKLTIDPMEVRLKSLEVFRDTVAKTLIGLAGILLFGLFAYAVANAIPGLNL